MLFHGSLWYSTSNNVKQFKAAKQMLSKARFQVSDCVDDYLSTQGIHWKSINELAPWMGGFYEAEAVINSCPITYVDDDIKSSVVLRNIPAL